MNIKNKQKYKELKRIHDEYGSIEPKTVVEVAKDVNNPLHNYFEWDDKKAGIEYRLWQARQLITKVYIVTEDDEKVQVFHNININEIDSAYQELPVILSNADKKKQLIQSALREIKYWQDKYKTISELSEIINLKKLKKLLLSFE